MLPLLEAMLRPLRPLALSWTFLCAAVLCVGCVDSATNPCQSEAGQSLIDHTRWTIQGPGHDLFGDNPAGLSCDPTGVTAENDAIEVHTGTCLHANLQQPSLVGVPTGGKLKLVLWHQQLKGADSDSDSSAPEPAAVSGHMAVRVGDAVVFDKTVAIPSLGQSYVTTVTVSDGFCEGAPVTFHVHNHGNNTWSLQSIVVTGQTSAD
ncbi:MAG: hypothetical protein KC502_05015 [Myxococcales bacterium]|nr:hypothetical protein [Myxococcales bacterium]